MASRTVETSPVPFEEFSLSHILASPEPFGLLNRIPIRDNQEPLVDLRVTNPELSFASYCLPYVRVGIADALQEATSRVPDHLELRMYTALRTLEQQAEMYWHNFERNREAHPTWPKSTVRRMTNRFFAPPDSKAPPGHCTGAAVDIGLHYRDSGDGIDVRSPLEGWKAAPTAALGLNPESAENRRLLGWIMHSTGLSNCRDEYWHWSYGDSAWAVRVGADIACYGLIEAPTDGTRVIGDKVVIMDYDAQWPDHFEMIRSGLSEAARSFLKIEHVGSTAIPDLSAKPILDIHIVVETDEMLTRLIEELSAFGYEHQGNLGVEGREAFKIRGDQPDQESVPKQWPKHHLYASLASGIELNRQLAFRDYLRGNSTAAIAYDRLKRELAARHPWDRTRYSDGKTAFVRDILESAG